MLDGDAVYVGTLGGLLLRLDAATGRKRWEAKTGGQIMGSANIHRAGPSGVTTVVVGSYDGSLYAVNARTGRVSWTYATGNFINGAPAVVGNLAVFGGCDGLLHAVSLLDGKEASAIPAGSYIPASPAVSAGRAFAGTAAGRLLCVDIATAKIAWQVGGESSQDGARSAGFFSSPAAGAGVVVVGSRDGSVVCLDVEDREDPLDVGRRSRGGRLPGDRRRCNRRGNHGRPARRAVPRRRPAALVVRDRRSDRRLPGGRRGHGDRGQR